ncbi:MAG: hypothetical protein ACI8T1_005084 [Verrucomicrobiales bacterium]|jgi:hypothetical protein
MQFLRMRRCRYLHLVALASLWLQRSPVLIAFSKLATPLFQTASARILMRIGATQTAPMHAVSGATTSIAPVSPSKNPAESHVGDRFTWVFRTSGGKSESYEVEDLPDGLTFIETNGIGSIQGEPTTHGDYLIQIVGWERPDFRGGSTESFTLRLQVRPEEGYGGFAQWAATKNLDPTISSPSDDPDRDGSDNLLEYAFDFDPLTPNRAFGPKDGVAPISTPEIVLQTSAVLQVAYIRRREDAGSEVNYVLESSSDLSQWSATTGETWITELNPDWEGVLTEISNSGRTQFLRMRLETKTGS